MATSSDKPDYTGPATQWVTKGNTGQYVGVPDAYLAYQGDVFDPAKVNYAGYRPTQAVYGAPIYTENFINSLYGKGKEQVFEVQKQLASMGYISKFRPGTMDEATYKAARQAAEDANKNGVTWEQMMRNRSVAPGFDKNGSPGGSGSSGSGGIQSSTTTQVQRSINLTSREAAMQILANALSQELGRQPTQDELTRFTQSLNRAEKANPTITKQTSTSTSRASGSHVSTSVSGTSETKQGNVDPQYQATEFAKSKPLAAERNRFQDSQYYNVIAQMIGAQ